MSVKSKRYTFIDEKSNLALFAALDLQKTLDLKSLNRKNAI